LIVWSCPAIAMGAAAGVATKIIGESGILSLAAGIKTASRFHPEDDQDIEWNEEEQGEEDESDDDDTGESAYRKARRARKERLMQTQNLQAEQLAAWQAAQEIDAEDDFSDYTRSFDDCCRLGYIKRSAIREAWIDEIRETSRKRNLNLDINSLEPPDWQDGNKGKLGGIVFKQKRLNQWPVGGFHLNGW